MRRRKYYASKLQMLCVEALRALRTYVGNKEVLRILDKEGVSLTPVDISRYVTGSVILRPARALQILEILSRNNLLGRVLERLVVIDENGVVNIARIASDLNILRLAAAMAFVEFKDVKIDRVMTAAVNGVPLAVMIANALDVEFCVAKHEADVSTKSYIEVRYFAPDPPRYSHLYLPDFSLKEGDRVMIVDDLLQSGRTLKALTELASKKRASVVAVFSLLSVGSQWRGFIPSETEKLIIGKEY